MTKIFVIGLEGATIERLLGDPGHVNFVRLAESGCFGPLTGDVPSAYEAAWTAFASGVGWTSSPSILFRDGLEVHPTQNETSPAVEHAVAASRQRFADAKAALQTSGFGYFQIIDNGLLGWGDGDAAYYEHLDRELGSLLETLSDDTILLVVALAGDVSRMDFQSVQIVQGRTGSPSYTEHSGFILSAANLSVSGELSDVTILDLSPALLELAGLEIPPSMHGRSFVTGSGVLQAEGEELSDDARQLILDRLSGLGYL